MKDSLEMSLFSPKAVGHSRHFKNSIPQISHNLQKAIRRLDSLSKINTSEAKERYDRLQAAVDKLQKQLNSLNLSCMGKKSNLKF
jgi:flagellar capping protein FliD